MAKIRLAVNRRWRDQAGDWQEETSFFGGTLWREAAENAAESLTKGARVIVAGSSSRCASMAPPAPSAAYIVASERAVKQPVAAGIWAWVAGNGGSTNSSSRGRAGPANRITPATRLETAAISASRLAKAKDLGVDTLVSACPWSERPLAEAGETAAIDVVDTHELLAESLGTEGGGSRGEAGDRRSSGSGCGGQCGCGGAS